MQPFLITYIFSFFFHCQGLDFFFFFFFCSDNIVKLCVCVCVCMCMCMCVYSHKSVTFPLRQLAGTLYHLDFFSFPFVKIPAK